jgi:Na+-transporting NADH:ubiquinone oxidoreductase subunit NqrE
MAGSFVLIWMYFLARQGALRAGSELSFGWNVALLAVVAALIVVFVRRLKRTLASLRDADPARRR